MTKHFFRMIFRSDLTDSPRHHEWIVGTLAELSPILEKELSSPKGSYAALMLSQSMTIECWQNSVLVASKPLGPVIELRVPGIDDPFLFDDQGEAFGPELDDDAAEFLGQQLFDGATQPKVKVNLKALVLPTLDGEPLKTGETAVLKREGDADLSLAYGHHAFTE